MFKDVKELVKHMGGYLEVSLAIYTKTGIKLSYQSVYSWTKNGRIPMRFWQFLIDNVEGLKLEDILRICTAKKD